MCSLVALTNDGHLKGYVGMKGINEDVTGSINFICSLAAYADLHGEHLISVQISIELVFVYCNRCVAPTVRPYIDQARILIVIVHLNGCSNSY